MAEDQAQAPERDPSRHELYLQSLEEERAAEGQPREAEQPNFAPYAVDGNEVDAFVGVSPEYRTYSGAFGQPMRAEEGATASAELEAEQRGPLIQPPANPPHPSEGNVAAESKVVAPKAVPEVVTETPKAPAKPPVPAQKPASNEK
jgi:hypothetical protein